MDSKMPPAARSALKPPGSARGTNDVKWAVERNTCDPHPGANGPAREGIVKALSGRCSVEVAARFADRLLRHVRPVAGDAGAHVLDLSGQSAWEVVLAQSHLPAGVWEALHDLGGVSRVAVPRQCPPIALGPFRPGDNLVRRDSPRQRDPELRDTLQFLGMDTSDPLALAQAVTAFVTDLARPGREAAWAGWLEELLRGGSPLVLRAVVRILANAGPDIVADPARRLSLLQAPQDGKPLVARLCEAWGPFDFTVERYESLQVFIAEVLQSSLPAADKREACLAPLDGVPAVRVAALGGCAWTAAAVMDGVTLAASARTARDLYDEFGVDMRSLLECFKDQALPQATSYVDGRAVAIPARGLPPRQAAHHVMPHLPPALSHALRNTTDPQLLRRHADDLVGALADPALAAGLPRQLAILYGRGRGAALAALVAALAAAPAASIDSARRLALVMGRLPPSPVESGCGQPGLPFLAQLVTGDAGHRNFSEAGYQAVRAYVLAILDSPLPLQDKVQACLANHRTGSRMAETTAAQRSLKERRPWIAMAIVDAVASSRLTQPDKESLLARLVNVPPRELVAAFRNDAGYLQAAPGLVEARAAAVLQALPPPAAGGDGKA